MDQTIEWYMQRLESVRGSGEAEIEAILDLSRALMEELRFDDAQSYLDKALAVSLAQQHQTHQRDIHGLLAIVNFSTQDIDSAFKHVQQAISLSHDQHEHLLEHFASLMIMLIMTPPDAPAHAYAESLIEELREKETEQVVIHQMIQMLAETYAMKGDADHAVSILEAEVDRTDETKWFALMQLGSLEIGLDRFNDGYRHLKEARQIASDQNDHEAEVVILMGLGSACVDSGRFENGVRYLKSALEISRQLGDPDLEQVAVGELGNAYAYSEDFEKALESYRELIDVARSNQDIEAEMMGWANSGNAHRDMDNPLEAIKAYQQALNLSRSLSNPFEEAEILMQMGQAYADDGELQKSIKHIEQAIPLFSQMNEEVEIGDAFLTMAEIYAEYDRMTEARDAAEKSRQIFEQLQLSELVVFVDDFIEGLQ